MNIKKILLSCYIRIVNFLSANLKGKYFIARITKKIHYFLITHFFKYPFAIVRNKLLFVHRKDKVISSHILWHHSYEDFSTGFIKTKIKDGDIALDIGANIGYFTVLFSYWVGRDGKVFSFEPEDRSHYLLKKNTRINNCRNVIIEKKGISDKEEKIKLFLNEEQKGAHSFWGKENEQKFIEIETITLDDYFFRNGIKVDFIKMDIEGAEPKALRGAEELFCNSTDLKGIFEFNPHMLKEAGEDALTFLSKFTTWGYKLYRLITKDKSAMPITPQLLIKDMPVNKDIVANIYFEKE